MLSLEKDKVAFGGHGHNEINSIRFKSIEQETLDPVDLSDIRSEVCYRAFFSGVKEGHTKIAIQVEAPIKRLIYLTKDEIKAWIALCIKNGLLPYYIQDKISLQATNKLNSDSGSGFIAKMVLHCHGWSQLLVYNYINSLRHIRESPGFIKAILYMCNEKNVDFFIANTLSAHFNIFNTNHHLFPIGPGIYHSWNGANPKDLKKDELDLKGARALYKLVYDPSVNRGLIIGHGAKNWICHALTKEFTKKDLFVPIKFLNDERVVKIVHTLDDAQAIELHGEFMKEIKKGD